MSIEQTLQNEIKNHKDAQHGRWSLQARSCQENRNNQLHYTKFEKFDIKICEIMESKMKSHFKNK